MSPTCPPCSQALNDNKMAPSSEPNQLFSARISNSSSPMRRSLQVQVGCSQPSTLQEQAQESVATGAQVEGDAGGVSRRWLSTSTRPRQ